MKTSVSHTIGSVINDIARRFEQANLYYGHGTENAYDEAAWLVLHCLDKPLDEDCDATEFVDNKVWQVIEAIAQERISGRKPLAYLLKSSWFCGMEFYIDERALIPRSPIAELIVTQFTPWLKPVNEAVHILDMCTGSACIAIAMAHHIDNAQVDACDISADALAVAKVNVDRYDISERVALYQSDMFASLPTTQQYDLIVCNPPYVDQQDMDNLPDEYQHEPVLALASGNDGLDFVRNFLQTAKQFLKPNGGIILEVGNSADALELAYPHLTKVWLEFEYGGEGICFIAASDLT